MKFTRAGMRVAIVAVTCSALAASTLAATALASDAIPDHDVAVNCAWHFASVPGSQSGVITLAAYAAASGHPGAVETGVECTLYDSSGSAVVTVSGVSPGHASAAPAAAIGTLSRFTTCVSGHGVWYDGHRVDEPRRCL